MYIMTKYYLISRFFVLQTLCDKYKFLTDPLDSLKNDMTGYCNTVVGIAQDVVDISVSINRQIHIHSHI